MNVNVKAAFCLLLVDSQNLSRHEFIAAMTPVENFSVVQLFTPLVEKCKSLGRAMRIGTNHGSLSARILSYYGDTPQ